MDFIRPLKPDVSGRKLLVVGRALTAVLIIVAALYAPLIERFGSLFQYFQATLSYIVPPIVAIYLGGLFWRRLNGAGAFCAILCGLTVGIALFLLKEVHDLPGHVEKGDDFIRPPPFNDGFGHSIHHATGAILSENLPPPCFDSLYPLKPILPHPGHNQPHRR